MNLIIDSIIKFLSSLIPNDYLLITVASAFPLIELKGGILLGISKGLIPLYVLILCYLGSSIIAPLILLLLRPILNLFKKIPVVNKFAHFAEFRLIHKAANIKNKNDLDINKSKNNILIPLFIFVAIPLPMTGVWTGAAVACFLNIDYLKSLLIILIGNLTAGIIVFTIALLFAPYVDIIFGMFLLIVIFALILSIVTAIVKSKKRSQNNSR